MLNIFILFNRTKVDQIRAKLAEWTEWDQSGPNKTSRHRMNE